MYSNIFKNKITDLIRFNFNYNELLIFLDTSLKKYLQTIETNY